MRNKKIVGAMLLEIQKELGVIRSQQENEVLRSVQQKIEYIYDQLTDYGSSPPARPDMVHVVYGTHPNDDEGEVYGAFHSSKDALDLRNDEDAGKNDDAWSINVKVVPLR